MITNAWCVIAGCIRLHGRHRTKNRGVCRDPVKTLNAIISVSICIVATVILSSPAAAQSMLAEDARRQTSEALHELLDLYFEDRLRHQPLFATSIGDHRYDDRYTVSIDPDFRRAESNRQRGYLRAASEIDPELLSMEDRVSLLIFQCCELFSYNMFLGKTR